MHSLRPRFRRPREIVAGDSRLVFATDGQALDRIGAVLGSNTTQLEGSPRRTRGPERSVSVRFAGWQHVLAVAGAEIAVDVADGLAVSIHLITHLAVLVLEPEVDDGLSEWRIVSR